MLAKLSLPCAALLTVIAAGCSFTEVAPEHRPAGTELEATIVVASPTLHHIDGSERTPLTFRIQDAAEWQRLRQSVLRYAEVLYAPDFARETVLGVVESAPTGGYHVRIDRVSVDERGGTVVAYTLVVPGVRCITTQALTYPSAFVAVRDLPMGPVRFEASRETYACE